MSLEIERPDPSLEARCQRLRDAVRRAGGPRAVARRAAMPEATLNNYLGCREMKVAALITLAEATDVSLEWLALGRGTPSQLDVVPTDLFDLALLEKSAHFWGLHMAIRSAREWFDRSGIRPSLRDVLVWVGPVYRLAVPLPDRPLELVDEPPKHNGGPGM